MKFIPNQFIWSQDKEEVIITFNNKYYEFCWHASSCAGNFPSITKEKIKVQIQKNQIVININMFYVPVFEGILEQSILVDESRWEYIPQIGIRVNLSKRDNKEWIKPFSSFEKEMYYKQFKIANAITFHQQQQEMQSQFPAEFLQQFSKTFQQETERIFSQAEDSLSQLRNGEYKKESYLKMWKEYYDSYIQMEQKGKVSTNMPQFHQSDVTQKKQIFQNLPFKKLKPIFMNDLEFGINEQSYILVQAVTDSIIMKSNFVLIQDSYKTLNRLYIYDLNNYKITKGTYILIKDPFIKFGARDHFPMLRIDNPKEEMILFADQIVFDKKPIQYTDQITLGQAENIEKIFDSQFQCVVFNLNTNMLRFTVMTQIKKSQNFLEGEPIIYVSQYEDTWIPGEIKCQKMINKNTYEIELKDSHQSQLFIECLKNRLEENMGDVITLTKQQNTNVEMLLQFILFNNKIPLKLTNKFEQVWNERKQNSKYLIQDIYQLFSEYKDQILLNNLSKKEKQKINIQPQPSNDYDKMIKIISQQVDDVIQSLNDFEVNKQKTTTQINHKDYVSNQDYKFDKDNFIIEKQKIIEDDKFKNMQVINAEFEPNVLDSHKIVDNLISEKDKEVKENSIFYLKQYVQRMKEENKIMDQKQFTNYVIKNKISYSECFNLDLAIKSFCLINFKIDYEFIEKLKRQKEKKKQNKKNRKKQKNREQIIEQLDTVQNQEIDIIDDETEVKEVISQFNEENEENNTDLDNQENILERIKEFDDLELNSSAGQSEIEIVQQQKVQINQNNEKEQEKDQGQQEKSSVNFSDSQSIQSLLTVHSKEKTQKKNDHWKDRLKQRFNLDISKKEVKDSLLQQIKTLLHQKDIHILQSKTDENRILIKDPVSKVQFVLQKTKENSNGKTVYVPVTILTSKMVFK